MAEDRDLGRIIAFYRQRRGLTQREFASLIDRSEAWLSQVERGVRSVKALDVLERIAKELSVPLSELAPTAPSVVAQEKPPEAIPLRYILSANYALSAALGNEFSGDVAELRESANRAWDLAHQAKYTELIPLLETLLPLLESAACSDIANEVVPLLAHTYQACSAALAKLRQFDAAWVAADRAISYAGRAGDPLLMAEGAFRLTLVFQGARQLDQAEYTAKTASAALSEVVRDGAPEALSLYGALQLQLAVIAARAERRDDARQYLAVARDIAHRIGIDRNDYNTEFGPTNVALHQVSVAVELGDAGEAIRRAGSIDASNLSTERQGSLLIDTARAWMQRRNLEKVLAALQDAERITPEQVHNHELVGILVSDLLRMRPNLPAELDAFARRLEASVIFDKA